ncbi:MAG TPA: FlgD immunoglobulin-like domain containing protein [bacterium]|nr:FlgD immunoglobulin-like domain containing protein [bacterium]
MKRILTAVITLIGLASVGIPASHSHDSWKDPLPRAVLQAAPWLKFRLALYADRIAAENPPEEIRAALFDKCIAAVVRGETSAGPGHSGLAAEARTASPQGGYDPYLAVPGTDSLCTGARLAINTVSNRILIVWQDGRNGVEDPDIYGQLYDLVLGAVGVNFRINPAGIKAAQIAPEVCALADGRFLVCWEDYITTTPRVLAQRVNPDGALNGTTVVVSPLTATPQYFPRVDSWGDSTHVVWLQDDGGDYNIYIRTLALSGTPKAPAVKVNDDDHSLQWIPAVAAYNSGQTVVVWEDKRNGDSEIYAQIYKADGVKRGDNFLVNTDAARSLQWRPEVAGDENHVQIVWEDYQNRTAAIYTQQYDSWGMPAGDNLRVDQPDLSAAKETPSVCINEQGQRVFAWQEESGEAWRLKFAICPALSDKPVYYTLGEEDVYHEFTGIRPRPIKNSLYFTFLGQPIGGATTVLAYRVTFTAVPVELATFQAVARDATVHLSWQTASETSNYGFAVERMPEEGEFTQAAFIPGMGTTSVQHTYEFTDRGRMPGKYHYRLRQIDLDGTSTLSGEIEVIVGGPDHFELLEAYPNPFETGTHLLLRLPVSSEVDAWVYNLLGQRVCRLAAGSLPSGANELNWDGRDEHGSPVPAGIYLLQARINGQMQSRRVALIR